MRFQSRSSRRKPVERITLNLASMIDVTFLILIYFLITTVLIEPEDRLTSAIQTQSDGAMSSDFQPQIIEVITLAGGEPVYRMGERIMRDRSELYSVVRLLERSEGIFVNVSNEVPVGFAVAAIQVARDAGFEQVTYVAQK